ncbi:hypothetical protein ARSEF4850_003110 [Beauveria asiatica]
MASSACHIDQRKRQVVLIGTRGHIRMPARQITIGGKQGFSCIRIFVNSQAVFACRQMFQIFWTNFCKVQDLISEIKTRVILVASWQPRITLSHTAKETAASLFLPSTTE